MRVQYKLHGVTSMPCIVFPLGFLRVGPIILNKGAGRSQALPSKEKPTID